MRKNTWKETIKVKDQRLKAAEKDGMYKDAIIEDYDRLVNMQNDRIEELEALLEESRRKSGSIVGGITQGLRYT